MSMNPAVGRLFVLIPVMTLFCALFFATQSLAQSPAARPGAAGKSASAASPSTTMTDQSALPAVAVTIADDASTHPKSLVRKMVDMFLKLDVTLGEIIRQYGNWTYGIMFMIVFCETGLVITPILPGDTLLFVAGTFAGISELNLWLMLLLLSVAAILGDTVNYWIGHFLGDEILKRRLIKQKYLDRTHEFFERYGGKTIVIARFVPIVRTIAPFVAGLGSMNYRKFIIYNIAGGIGWVVSITLVGYFFGNIPFIKKNLTAAIMIIVVLSMLPGVFEYWRQRRELAKAKR